MSRPTPDTAFYCLLSRTGLSPSTAGFPKTVLLGYLRIPRSIPQCARTLVWALPISLAATLGIDVSYSSSPYLDVSVQEVPFHTLCIGVWIPLCGGFPHSEISGSMDICSSPKLFAAYHVFHRLSVPRHPPCALLRLTSSYACVCVWVFKILAYLAVQCVYIVF